jgi:hypothetical protein
MSRYVAKGNATCYLRITKVIFGGVFVLFIDIDSTTGCQISKLYGRHNHPEMETIFYPKRWYPFAKVHHCFFNT